MQVTVTKNDLLIEFHQDDTDLGKEDDQLTEIKFFVPTNSRYNADNKEISGADALREMVCSP